ncbi:MAG: BPSS1780 family membrane protein [Candidatus Dactylopiibacterium sp.]|nr:BPSS1780 family membrane protein [Candidatus Dactylopiibacterium sp.]
MPSRPRIPIHARRVPARHGVAWLRGGWTLFRQQPLAWLLIMAACFLSGLLISLLPVVNLLSGVLYPVFWGGLMFAAHRQHHTGKLTPRDLFAGFRARFASLALLGLLAMAAMLLTVLPLIVTGGASLLAHPFAYGDALAAWNGLSLAGLFVACVAGLLVWLTMGAALWFAPALVMLAELEPLAALRASLSACLRNPLAGLVYGALSGVLLVLGCLPLLTGLVFVVPVLTASAYVSYRDLFIDA